MSKILRGLLFVEKKMFFLLKINMTLKLKAINTKEQRKQSVV
jgi:hypothetical protein